MSAHLFTPAAFEQIPGQLAMRTDPPRGELVPGAALAAAVAFVLLSGGATTHPPMVTSAAAAQPTTQG